MANKTTPVIQIQEGKVGINTITPDLLLTVHGNTRLGRAGNNYAGDPNKVVISGQGIEDSNTGNFYGSYGFLELSANTNYTGGARKYAITNALGANKFAIIRSDSNLGGMQIGANGAVPTGAVADFVINNTGGVGIGYESPTQKLDVAGNARIGGAFQGVELILEATDTAGAPAMTTTMRYVGYEGRGIGNLYTDQSYAGEWFAGLNYSGGFSRWSIGYDGSTGQSEYLTKSLFTVRNTGNVGIGDTSPSYKLTVPGSFKLGTNAYIEYGGVYTYTITTANTAAVGNLVFSAGLGSAAYESRIDLQGTDTATDAGITLNSKALTVVTNTLADAKAGVPNENLLNLVEGIQISNRPDMYANAVQTKISLYESRYANDATGGTTIRLYVDDGVLSDGEIYTVSVFYKDLIGTLSLDWCDESTIGNYKSATGTANNPKSGRLYGYASRATYTSTYRFFDINLSNGQDNAVTLLNPKVEFGKVVTDFTPYSREGDVEPQTSMPNDIALTGKISSVNTASNSVLTEGITLALVSENSYEKTYVGILSFANSGGQIYRFNLAFYGAGAYGFDVDMVTGRSGNWRNFGRIKDSGYLYWENDGDFAHMTQGPLDVISTYSSGELTLDSAPTYFLTDTVTDTSAGGSNPWSYFVRRYAIRMPSTLTGTNGYLKIMVKLQGSIQGNSQKVIFLNQQ